MPMMLDALHSAVLSGSKMDLPHLVVSPASASDVRTLVDIEFHAFENERANQQLSYRDYTKPEHFERAVQAYMMILSAKVQAQYQEKNSMTNEASMKNSEITTDQVSLRKVTNIETGQILSFAKAEFKAYTLSELSSAADIGHEDDPQMNRDWFALNESMRRQYMGLKRHCCEYRSGMNFTLNLSLKEVCYRYRDACYPTLPPAQRRRYNAVERHMQRC